MCDSVTHYFIWMVKSLQELYVMMDLIFQAAEK